jgi:hypothetical protein
VVVCDAVLFVCTDVHVAVNAYSGNAAPPFVIISIIIAGAAPTDITVNVLTAVKQVRITATHHRCHAAATTFKRSQSFVDAFSNVNIFITQDDVFITLIISDFVTSDTALSRRLDASSVSTAATNVTVSVALPAGTDAASAAAQLNANQAYNDGLTTAVDANVGSALGTNVQSALVGGGAQPASARSAVTGIAPPAAAADNKLALDLGIGLGLGGGNRIVKPQMFSRSSFHYRRPRPAGGAAVRGGYPP